MRPKSFVGAGSSATISTLHPVHVLAHVSSFILRYGPIDENVSTTNAVGEDCWNGGDGDRRRELTITVRRKIPSQKHRT